MLELLKRDETYPDFIMQLGKIFGEADFAENYYEQCLCMNPKDPKIHLDFAKICTKLRKYFVARTYYEKSLKLNDKDFRAHFDYGRFLEQYCKDYKLAKYHYTQSLKHNTADPAVHYHFGLLLETHFVEYELAVSHYKVVLSDYEKRLAVEITPKAHFDLGIIHERLRHYQLARKHWQEGLKLDNTNADAHLKFAKLLWNHLDERELARNHILQSLELDNTNAEYHLFFARLLFCSEEHELARIHFETCLKIDSKHAQGHFYFGRLLEHHYADYELAKHHYKESIKHDKRNPNAYFYLAWLLKDHFQDKSLARFYFVVAQQYYKKILALAKTSAAYFNVGNVYTELRNYEKAREYFEKGLELDSNNANARMQLGNAFRDTNKPELAKIQYEKSLKLQPDLSGYINLAALYSSDFEQYEKAKLYLELSLELKPNYCISHGRLGRLLFQNMNDDDAAMQHFEKSLLYWPITISGRQKSFYQQELQENCTTYYRVIKKRQKITQSEEIDELERLVKSIVDRMENTDEYLPEFNLQHIINGRCFGLWQVLTPGWQAYLTKFKPTIYNHMRAEAKEIKKCLDDALPHVENRINQLLFEFLANFCSKEFYRT